MLAAMNLRIRNGRGPLHTAVILASGLVDDGAVFQTSKVKHANAAILAAADENIDTIRAKANIIYFLVVGNELRLCRERRYIPDRACRIDTTRYDQAGRNGVPVEGRKGRRVIRRLRVGEERKRCQLGRAGIPVWPSNRVAAVGGLGVRREGPQPEVVTRGCKQISRLLLARRWLPEESRHRVGVRSFGYLGEVETLVGATWSLEAGRRGYDLGIEYLDLPCTGCNCQP